MKIDICMTVVEDKFNAQAYWAKSPEFVLSAIRAHLAAAAVIWPELADYHLACREARVGKARGGRAGGDARAANLSADRRKEIASNAAKARWGQREERVDSTGTTTRNADGTTIS